MNSLSAADLADVSYRQLDYWIRKGYIRGSLPGSGHQRNLNGHEVDVLMHLAALVKAGIRVDVAAQVAREWADGGAPTLPGFTLAPTSDRRPRRLLGSRPATGRMRPRRRRSAA